MYPQLVRIRDVKRGYSETYYSGDYPEEYLITSGDLLIGMDGEFNIARWKSDRALLNQRVCKLTAKKGTNEEYLRFVMSKVLKEIEQKTAFVTVKHLSAKELNKLYLNVPELSEQNKIAEMLSRLEKIIDMRRREIEKLDDLIKSRFVEMFGNETEFDKWPYCTVGDVADVCVGVVIKPTQYYAQKNQKSVVHKNDVLVVRSGAPGTACVATEKYDGYNAVDIIIAHPDNSKVNSTFLAAFTNMPHGVNQIRERTGGAAQQHFNVGGYKAMRLIMPSIELQNQFAAFIAQVDKSKLTIQKSLDELETLNKALMQKYFGGNGV